MWHFILRGGPVIFPILLGSVVGFAIVIERIILLMRVRTDSSAFVQEVFRLLKTNKAQKALELCEANIGYPLAAVFKIGIERRNISSPERLERILEQVGNNQVQRLEKRLGALASIIGIEPLLGFLGTITGLIKAFMSWEQAGANITVNALALGIYEAMITTAAGLSIAIPLYLFYNYFISRIKYIATDLNNYAIQLIEVIFESREAVKP